MRTVSIFSEKGHLWFSLPSDFQIEGFSVAYEKQEGTITARIDGELYLIPFKGTVLQERIPYNKPRQEKIRWLGDSV